ncbi:hypothetical protein Tco_0717984 [Tanacetum coccineum]
MDSNFTNENDPWEYSLDIDDSDLHLTHVLRSSSSAHVEPSPYTPNPVTIIPGPAGVVQLSNSICVEPSSSTPNPVRIIPGPAGLVQRAKLLKENVFILDPDGALMSTQEYMQKVVEDVGEDADFNSGAWVSATNYVNAFGGTVTGCLGDIDNFLKKGKLEQVVAIVKSCSPNALGDLNVTLKDLSGTVPGTIHYKVLDVGSYEKDITVGAAMILANVLVFTPKPSKHYLNITKRNVVEVFRKDTDQAQELSKSEKPARYERCLGLQPDIIDSYARYLLKGKFRALAEILGLMRSDGIEIQRCYLDYLEALVSHYKAARSSRNPIGGYEGIRRFEDYHGDGNMGGSLAAKEKGRVEHFGITLKEEEEGKHKLMHTSYCQ